LRRFDVTDIDENIDGGINRKRNDFGHGSPFGTANGGCHDKVYARFGNWYFLIAFVPSALRKFRRNVHVKLFKT
jgi:hypothetical protein